MKYVLGKWIIKLPLFKGTHGTSRSFSRILNASRSIIYHWKGLFLTKKKILIFLGKIQDGRQKIQDGRRPTAKNTLARAQVFSANINSSNLIFTHNLPFLLLKSRTFPDF